MTATIAERVAAGAEWLNDNEPGWYKRIDLDRLDISNCTDCVWGQLVGDYDDRPNELREAGVSCRLGFLGGMSVELLTAEWRRVIEAHRASLGGTP